MRLSHQEIRIAVALFIATLACLFLPGRAAAENAFLEGSKGFITTVVVSDSKGFTYQFGRVSTNGFMRKYDQAGAQVGVDVATSIVVLAAYVDEDDNIVVAGDSPSSVGVQILDTDGSRRAEISDTDAVKLRGVTKFEDTIYVAGYTLSSAAQTLFGQSVGGNGTTDGFVVALPTNAAANSISSGTAAVSIGGGRNSSAWAVETDETGDVYVAGATRGASGAAGDEIRYLFQPSGVLEVTENDQSNQGYIAKFNGALSANEGLFVPSPEVGPIGGALPFLDGDGEFFDLQYFQGWIYAVGYNSGYFVRNARNGDLIIDDTTNTTVEVVRLDTNLTLSGRATVESATASIRGLEITSDERGNIYMVGEYGPGGVDFINDGGQPTETGGDKQVWKQISGARRAQFVAQLDANLDFQWVNQPIGSVPTAFTPDPNETDLAWNRTQQRLYYVSNIGGGELTFGDPDVQTTIRGGQAFLAALEQSGDFTTRVELTVVSRFGESQTQVIPFGGPENAPVSRFLIKGAEVNASVPEAIYRDIAGNELTNPTDTVIENVAESRFVATGYALEDGSTSGPENFYTFTLEQDTTLKFTWSLEYALTIDSDLSGTIGSIIGGLDSKASGLPTPDVKKHWIEEDELVVATIDGIVLDVETFSQNIRYVPTGYIASGPPNINTTNADLAQITQTDTFAFTRFEVRQQVPQFVMNAPGKITYQWKKQNLVQVDTTGVQSFGLPLVQVVDNSGQASGFGVGQFWYDENTSLKIGTVANFQEQALQGWFNGDGFTVSPDRGLLADLPDTFTGPSPLNDGSTTEYVGFDVPDLRTPASVLWDYGDRIFTQTVRIGNPVLVNEDIIDDPYIYSIIRGDLRPESITVEEGPEGSTNENVALWDEAGKKLFPVRPGRILIAWNTDHPNSDVRVLMRVNVTYPALPHYRHVAETPPVPLDPDPSDFIEFSEVNYAENDASADELGLFTATEAGKSVLVFNEISETRTGVVRTLRIRVVETKTYLQTLVTRDATIGERIISPYDPDNGQFGFDRANLGTGYIFFPTLARYNPAAYAEGPIIPVNKQYDQGEESELVVIWYEQRDKILWPYTGVLYEPDWPTAADGLSRIVIASRFGNEAVAADGSDQTIMGTTNTTFDPSKFADLLVYNQPVRGQPGYNPNEEHGLIAASLRSADVSPRPDAVYALRENDLNITTPDSTYTSDPYVLVQYRDLDTGDLAMAAFNVVKEDPANGYIFELEMVAGEPVIPYYPLPFVIGATPCVESHAIDGDPNKRTFFKDVKNGPWAVSDGFFNARFQYPLTPEFWWRDDNGDGIQDQLPGDCVAFLPDDVFDTTATAIPLADPPLNLPAGRVGENIRYDVVWPDNPPTLKVGETLTFSGGEFAQDFSDAPGLPGVIGFASGQIVYDDLNPAMDKGDPASGTDPDVNNYTARFFQALEERSVELEALPDDLAPATGRVRSVDGVLIFDDLSPSIQKRVTYDPILQKLAIKGFLNDKDIGDSTLTAAPPAVYILEPNIMTPVERDELLALSDNADFDAAVTALYNLSRNPNEIALTTAGTPSTSFLVGLERKIRRNNDGSPITEFDASLGRDVIQREDERLVSPETVLGPGGALTANPNFLDPDNASLPQISYVTVAENNESTLTGAPITMHIIKVDRTQRYRGAIKTVFSDNAFAETVTLRHTGDFMAMADDLVFEWWYRSEDGEEADTPDRAVPNPWLLFGDPSGNQGQGFFQLKIEAGPSQPDVLLSDQLFFVRYRHVNDDVSGTNWTGVPFQWAGAGNSLPPELGGEYLPQLVFGWVKRVLDAVNPYEARITDFTGDAPATYVSMIRQFGPRYEGPIALNPDKDVIENSGLIQLYGTVFNRAQALSINLSTPIVTNGIVNALQLVSTRLSDFYVLLGNEAYVDALDPTIGIGSDSADPGNLNPEVHTFQNMVSGLLEEELALLRGQDAFLARPVYNRMFWNFTKGEGEAAYAVNYDVNDVNQDGFINEDDAMIQYPQGHGDAWGHYLTATKFQYDLLRNPFFFWVSRSEFYNLQDIVFRVDFLDERKFAKAAALKARAGSEIVDLTYRSDFVDDPGGNFLGYTDPDTSRAWGVEGWARRAGQAAYFDWVTANALIPSEHPDGEATGVQRIDRETVKDIFDIGENLNLVQLTFDEANQGVNPLGIASEAVTFDLDPTLFATDSAVAGKTHFPQIYERAVAAWNNAFDLWEAANDPAFQLRKVQKTVEDFRREVIDQERDYRNQLIEIFGTPYDGVIGSGNIYPAGYEGPDLLLHMYVDVLEVSEETVPGATQSFIDDRLTKGRRIQSVYPGAYTDAPDLGTGLGAGQGQQDVLGNHTAFLADLNALQGFDGVDYTSLDNPKITFRNLEIPISTQGFAFQAPSGWGSRKSPGTLQRMLSEMLQAEAEIAEAMARWDDLTGEILEQMDIIISQMLTDQAAYNRMVQYRDKIRNINISIGVISTVSVILQIIADQLDGTLEGIAEALPVVVGLANDVTSAGRGALKIGGSTAKGVLENVAAGLDQVVNLLELSKEEVGINHDIDQFLLEAQMNIRPELAELNGLMGDEAPRRIGIFKSLEALREVGFAYQAELARGQRLIEERQNFNFNVAAITQKNRYQDMTFRVARNSRLQKYRSAFELAARYTYLAAKAYEYETNLGDDHPGSASHLFERIISARHLGIRDNTISKQPVLAGGGLGEILATMKINYDGIFTQLGINNPQIETGRFSLRTENFRIQNDAQWREVLENARVDNLWDVYEFRRHCRPFAAFDPNVPEPGIVLEFRSTIESRKNFFGKDLGGGDHAYDPTNYSTRIMSTGIWLEEYDGASLEGVIGETPRFYLIPVGSDIMTQPYSPDLEKTVWDIVDQRIPVPLPLGTTEWEDDLWTPVVDSLQGSFGEIRKHNAIRAHYDHGYLDEDDMTVSTRLVGRSAWNTRWLLIIPGSTFSADPEEGLDAFINGDLLPGQPVGGQRDGLGVKDIKLFFSTYGYSGN